MVVYDHGVFSLFNILMSYYEIFASTTSIIDMLNLKHAIEESRLGSQDGGGIGRVITVSSTNSLKEQQNSEQSLQNNF